MVRQVQSSRLLDWTAPSWDRSLFRAEGCSDEMKLFERMKICNNQSQQLSACRIRGDNVERVLQVGLGSQLLSK